MRIKGKGGEYPQQPEYKRERKAIEWCLRFLKLDLDRLRSREFVKLVRDYESIVIYPKRPHVKRRYQDDDNARTEFKGYQKIAEEFIVKIKELLPDKPIHVKVPRRVVISTAPDGKININSSGRQGFKFSFAHHIARLLNGKKYDETVKSCPYCGLFFPVLTQHKRKFCSRGCAAKYKQKKKREENPEMARKRGRLQTKWTRVKQNFPTNARRRKELTKYIKKNAYDKNEIPEKIKTFIEMKD